MQVMPYAKTRTKVSDDESSRYGQDNDEDADDTRRLSIANGDRRQFESHERQRHGIAGSKQDNAAGGAGGVDEAGDCQEHQAGHQQWKPNLEVRSDPSSSGYPGGFLHVRSDLDKHSFHNIDPGRVALEDHDND